MVAPLAHSLRVDALFGGVVRIGERFDQAQLLRFLADGDGVTWRAGEMVLAVTGHLRVDLHILGHDDFQLTVAIDHDGSPRQGMGVHGHNHNSVELGMHDRPPGRQRVGQGLGVLARGVEVVGQVEGVLGHAVRGGLGRQPVQLPPLLGRQQVEQHLAQLVVDEGVARPVRPQHVPAARLMPSPPCSRLQRARLCSPRAYQHPAECCLRWARQRHRRRVRRASVVL